MSLVARALLTAEEFARRPDPRARQRARAFRRRFRDGRCSWVTLRGPPQPRSASDPEWSARVIASEGIGPEVEAAFGSSGRLPLAAEGAR